MPVRNKIRIYEFCKSHQVDIAFVETLHQSGLIELVEEGKEKLVYVHELPRLERIIRLYYELNINVEGIDVISHLLQKVEQLQQEMQALQNRLMLYEG